MWYARIDSGLSHTGYAQIMDTGNPSASWVREPFQRLVRHRPSTYATLADRAAIVPHRNAFFARIARMIAEEGEAVGSIELKDHLDLSDDMATAIAGKRWEDLAALIEQGPAIRSMTFRFQQHHYVATADGFWHVSPDDRASSKGFRQIQNVLVRVTDPAAG
jgi:hypothetical protein